MVKKELKFQISLAVTILTLAISLTSFLYLSYAWFTFTGSQQTNALNIKAESGVEYQLKYFVKNYPPESETMGYPSPNAALTSEDIVTVDNYDTDFVAIQDDPMIDVLGTVGVFAEYPGLRFTYALEVMGSFAQSKTIRLIMNEYLATPSTTCYDTSTNAGITMARATNIFATATDSTQDLTTIANTFVTNTSPIDLFTSIDPDGPIELTLASRTMLADQTPNDKLIYFFTVEYSNISNTFYSYYNTINNVAYYTINPNGDSNVYKGLSFKINELWIHVV